MAHRAAGRGSGDGIDRAILEACLGSAGAILEGDVSESGRWKADVGDPSFQEGSGSLSAIYGRPGNGWATKTHGSPCATTHTCVRPSNRNQSDVTLLRSGLLPSRARSLSAKRASWRRRPHLDGFL